MKSERITTCDAKGCTNEHTTFNLSPAEHSKVIADAGWREYKIIGAFNTQLCKNCAYHKVTP